MAIKDNRAWTVIVMRPGQETRSYAVGKLRRFSVASAVAMSPIAMLVLGYHWGTEDKFQAAEAALISMLGSDSGGRATASERPSPRAPVKASGVQTVAVAAKVGPAQDVAPQELGDVGLEGDGTAPDMAVAGMTDDGKEDLELTLQLDNGLGQVVEIRPFNSDGKPLRGAFSQVRDAMACGDGRAAMPNARLVRLLVDAHKRFGTPVRILGGHCGAHDDQLEATVHHTQGRAADIRLKGVSTARLSGWLREREQVPGGLGRYARKGFVHVDLRPGEPVAWEAQTPKGQRAKARPGRAKKRPAPKPTADGADGRAEASEQTAPPEPAVDDADGPKAENRSAGASGAKPGSPTARAKTLTPTARTEAAPSAAPAK
ncbi:MAG: D-Ala-D-Ala carboxypeptidase family metallohydrolase [Myxococcales bacterium]|nr:D-Ala-D-Ala carboxypeptidase family metallohydrolase [Myxococcales bacterium]